MDRPDPGELVQRWQQRFESVLEDVLPAADEQPGRLHEAMRYSALAGGKRFRPVLTYAVGHALGLGMEAVDPIASSIECIHAYSLIHDDLPAMDDDDLRRGRPTCHRAYDEATAILAGDALQAAAFEILSSAPWNDLETGMLLIREVSIACGSVGMAGGQALDLNAVGQQLVEEDLNTMHRLKTGALIRAAVRCPALLAKVQPELLEHLTAYADCVGLAFQVHDDILDVTGDSDRIGKATLADQSLNKPTYPSILGLEKSMSQARQLRDTALDHLAYLDGDRSVLAWLANLSFNETDSAASLSRIK